MGIDWTGYREIYVSKERIAQAQVSLSDELSAALVAAGEEALTAGPFSVMDK